MVKTSTTYINDNDIWLILFTIIIPEANHGLGHMDISVAKALP